VDSEPNWRDVSIVVIFGISNDCFDDCRDSVCLVDSNNLLIDCLDVHPLVQHIDLYLPYLRPVIVLLFDAIDSLLSLLVYLLLLVLV
jgi:hypothetical protein